MIFPAKPGSFFNSCPEFKVGQLVKHRRYNYRGVVYGIDLKFEAGEDWYQNNKTQPDKDQAWYHVLVHESMATTYTAQSSLVADESQKMIEHPLISKFFNGFEEGIYIPIKDSPELDT